MTWHIVQFHEDGQHYRTIPFALEDGYTHGDRFLEGVMFEIRPTEDGEDFTVQATQDADVYLRSKKSSPEQWEEEIKQTLLDRHADCLTATEEFGEDGWDVSELHLTNDLGCYDKMYERG